MKTFICTGLSETLIYNFLFNCVCYMVLLAPRGLLISLFSCRGEKAFCSFDCRLEEIFAEEEIEKSQSNSSKSSPRSSYHEDLFVMGMPMT